MIFEFIYLYYTIICKKNYDLINNFTKLEDQIALSFLLTNSLEDLKENRVEDLNYIVYKLLTKLITIFLTNQS